MAGTDEVFISYSHDSVEHVKAVLALSNRLRSDGIDCVIDQYEESPPTGWPRWMDKKIRDSRYVLMVCTEAYYNRVMGDEEKGHGLGVRWEGNLVYQHIYDNDSNNDKFIPVLLNDGDQQFIPTPVKGVTRYAAFDDDDYHKLVGRISSLGKVEKPPLGKANPLPEKPVKTDPTMFLGGPIDIELWDAARWGGTFFLWADDKPPVLGLAFENEQAARDIFTAWHTRFGSSDEFEELRVSIVEGPIEGKEDGYSVHVGSDLDGTIARFKESGFAFDYDMFMLVSRIHRMTPPPESTYLASFKQAYRRFKTYFLAPGWISADKSEFKPFLDLGIYKSKVHFRHVDDLTDNDIDKAVMLNDEAAA